MELTLADGRIAIMLSGERHVFSNKAEADVFVARIIEGESKKADARAV
jgi:hypothetical protein